MHFNIRRSGGKGQSTASFSYFNIDYFFISIGKNRIKSIVPGQADMYFKFLFVIVHLLTF